MPTQTGTAADLIESAVQTGQPGLSERDSKTVLASYGIATIAEELVGAEDEAVEAAKRLGYPVVLKACAPNLAHKTDRGLVALNLDDESSIRTAFPELVNRAEGADLEGYLVQRMARGKREIIVGGTRDKVFGPSVMLGLGGIFVEAFADVVFRLAPLEELDAIEMINEIRAQRLFEAIRGEPAIDRFALSQVLIAVGRILVDNPRVAQVDVNPVIFEGARPVAVDALITLTAA